MRCLSPLNCGVSPTMNVFELAFVAAPIAGLVAGARAGAGHGIPSMLVCAFLGLCTGALICPGLLLVMLKLVDRVLGWPVHPGEKKPGSLPRIMGTTIVVYAGASPFAAWLLAAVVVSWFRGATP